MMDFLPVGKLHHEPGKIGSAQRFLDHLRARRFGGIEG
jgi:hypothetical protein